MFGVGGGFGIVLSGVIVDHFSWRWLFILGSIAVAASIVLVHRFVPESPAHQACDSLLAHAHAVRAQLGLDARGAVGLARVAEGRFDHPLELAVSQGAPRRRAPAPGVIASRAHLEHGAEPGEIPAARRTVTTSAVTLSTRSFATAAPIRAPSIATSEPYSRGRQNLTTGGPFGANSSSPKRTKGLQVQAFLGGASRTRTGDPLGAIQVLSQLSYSPARVEV